ncbi:transposase [Nonomuraea roseola]|uniref:Transposase n=1 Tax=Nonomuraea roseola TaxID=46179 RepID=A0ABV5QEP1_9ACTN
MTAPEVADLLECNAVTVRGAVHRFATGGFDWRMPGARAARPQSPARTARRWPALLDESARQGRTWTAAALCDWLAAERGARVSVAWLTGLLHRDRFRWKRSRDTLRHKADSVLQQAARARLADLRLDACESVRNLYFRDESGCRDKLAVIRVEVFYLPPRSPELNDIERVWRSAKYEDYPERVHTTNEAIGTAVDQALNRQRARINGSAANFTKAA